MKHPSTITYQDALHYLKGQGIWHVDFDDGEMIVYRNDYGELPKEIPWHFDEQGRPLKAKCLTRVG